jgi:hypothetical protein
MNDHALLINRYYHQLTAEGKENWMENIWRINHNLLGPKLQYQPAIKLLGKLLEGY